MCGFKLVPPGPPTHRHTDTEKNATMSDTEAQDVPVVEADLTVIDVVAGVFQRRLNPCLNPERPGLLLFFLSALCSFGLFVVCCCGERRANRVLANQCCTRHARAETAPEATVEAVAEPVAEVVATADATEPSTDGDGGDDAEEDIGSDDSERSEDETLDQSLTADGYSKEDGFIEDDGEGADAPGTAITQADVASDTAPATEPEPVVAAVEPEPEPVVAAVEPEPEPVVAAVEPVEPVAPTPPVVSPRLPHRCCVASPFRHKHLLCAINVRVRVR